MLDLSYSSNVQDIIAALSHAERRHLRFAQALALTTTAWEGAAEVKAKLPEHFTLRRPWVAKGIRVERADMRASNPSAKIYTRDWFMEDQETGGSRRARGAHGLMVPTNAIRKGGTPQGAPLKRPRTLVKQAKRAAEAAAARRGQPFRGSYRKPTPFLVDLGDEGRMNLKPGIYIRRSSGPRETSRHPLLMLYRTIDRATLPPRWRFQATVSAVAARRLRKHFVVALARALRTDRGGPRRNWYVDYLVETEG
jgi:hypothetical protein